MLDGCFALQILCFAHTRKCLAESLRNKPEWMPNKKLSGIRSKDEFSIPHTGNASEEWVFPIPAILSPLASSGQDPQKISLNLGMFALDSDSWLWTQNDNWIRA